MSAAPLSMNTVNTLKELTGHDKIPADVKYKDHIYFHNHAKIICATNHPIKLSEYDEALIERFIVIPFKYSIPANERDPHLLEKIKLEMDSIAKSHFTIIRSLSRIIITSPVHMILILSSIKEVLTTESILTILLNFYVKIMSSIKTTIS